MHFLLILILQNIFIWLIFAAIYFGEDYLKEKNIFAVIICAAIITFSLSRESLVTIAIKKIPEQEAVVFNSYTKYEFTGKFYSNVTHYQILYKGYQYDSRFYELYEVYYWSPFYGTTMDIH